MRNIQPTWQSVQQLPRQHGLVQGQEGMINGDRRQMRGSNVGNCHYVYPSRNQQIGEGYHRNVSDGRGLWNHGPRQYEVRYMD